MPVSFSRLRIAGFKSFAEPATVEILPGLTGIVGPNGCGKSNVVDALRWAMGEQNARTLRGGEMEDVIFAGAAGRPSRNIAEVALTLDETVGVAPPPFHEQPELEVIRRIERGSGSSFRVNGREARARDVQTLFADLASGARASAMVSQGRVGALVAARPEGRRAVLEEAAGITGLHARRHEAELKLRQAEQNLARTEDLKSQLDAQLAGLKRQARQASRYRNISGAIRTAEAELYAIQRTRAEQARADSGAAVEQARTEVAAATREAEAADKRAAEASEALPALRESEAAARTALERHRLAGEQIAAEEERARAALREAERRLQQIGTDLAHAEQLRGDAASAETRLAEKGTRLAEADTGHASRAEAAERCVAEATESVRLAETEANRATEEAAEASARAQAAEQMLAQAEQRVRRAVEQHTSAIAERDRVRAQAVDPALVAEAEAKEAAATSALGLARAEQETAEQARAAGQAALAEARTRQAAADSSRAKLAAETRALAEVLAVKDGERWPPMVDALSVPAGLEAALGAVLGEELSSAADRDASRHWRELPQFDPLPVLPEGAVALSTLVAGPPALARALSQTGFVGDEATGDAGQLLLGPGQALVSREGAVWRWDGYTIRAGTQTAAAVRLQQRNRLTALQTELAAANARAGEATAARAEAETVERDATEAEHRTRAARRESEQVLERARAAAAQLKAQAASAAARIGAAEQQAATREPERADAEATLSRARTAHAALPDIAGLRTRVEQARATLSRVRAAETSARAELDGIVREHATREARLQAITSERADWRERAADAISRVSDLTARKGEAETEHAALLAAPAQAHERRVAALEAQAEAENAHRRAGQALAASTQRSAEADSASRAAAASLARSREGLIRAEALATQADHAWGTVAERILERFGANAVLPELPAGSAPAAEVEEKARKRLERLFAERDEMGPVNLRAEMEVAEVEQQITAIERERQEIGTAIAKLRGSIGHLNREGRERLSTVFEEVDRQFQALFARMFGGGRAHLALVGSDDALTAGLEIYAQPPGKRLATLSLLSGGEQALTALSLIFAVFRCSPAPICVLDEVDAPLDDANVERFCLLLEDMVRESGTRFLVVTHHPLTMSRMDRLYGVTMQERGISRLLSVDLRQAEAMVEPERAAAE